MIRRLLALLLIPSLSFGAVSIVDKTAVTGGGTITAGAGSNRVLACKISEEVAAGTTTLAISTLAIGSSTLANGKILTAISKANTADFTRGLTAIYYIKEANIEAGAQTIAATWNQAVSGTDLFECYTLAGVNQTTPLDTTQSSATTAGIDPLTGSITVASNTVQILSGESPTPGASSAPDAAWTEDQDANDTNLRAVSQSKTTATGASVTWTLDFSVAQNFNIAIASFAPSVSQSPTTWAFVAAGTFASADGGGTLTPGLPSGHASGHHLIWVGRERNTANTLAIPSGYTEIYSVANAGVKYLIVADKIDGGSESAPSTTAVGVAEAQLFAFSGGPATLTGLLHASATTSSTCTTTPPIPALTITADNTLVLGISTQLDDYTGFTSNPTGFTTAAHNAYDGSSDLSLLAAYQVQTTATNISADTFTTSGATSNTCRGLTLSLNSGVSAGTVSITSVNTTNSIAYTDTNKVATVTGAGAAQGASTFKLIDQAGSIKATQSIDSWADTSIQFDPTQGNVRFGTISYELAVSGSDTATRAGSLTVPSGEWYSDISGIVALDFNPTGTATGRIKGQPNRYYDSPTDLQNGDQLHCKRTGGSGTLTLNANGTFTSDSTFTQMQCRKWNSGTWGSFQTWDITGAPPTFIGPNP